MQDTKQLCSSSLFKSALRLILSQQLGQVLCPSPSPLPVLEQYHFNSENAQPGMLLKTLNFLFSKGFLSNILPNLLGLVAFVVGAISSLLALIHFILSVDL